MKPSDVIEQYRRERGDASIDCNQVRLNTRFEALIDYSSAGLRIDTAMHHLDEGLPLRQRERCTLAFKELERGVFELRLWMSANGYPV